MSYLPRLALTLGDPAGVGPEVIVRALADRGLARQVRPVVVGDAEILKRAAQVCRVKLKIIPVTAAAPDWAAPGVVPVLAAAKAGKNVVPGRWTRHTGQASLAAVTAAVRLVLGGDADALVTAPICKEAWRAAGAHYPGHTELLAALCRSRAYAMMFVGGPFRLVLATIHEPLARVPRLLTAARIIETALIGARELKRRFGIERPKLAVAGLNPHAGEGGLFGREEIRVIGPAVKALARRRDLVATGPYPPDTLFAQAAGGAFDLIVCMYHDQGLIPFKLAALHSGVNVTAGLPLIRTSPDHGTAFALAGTGRALPGSMAAAIRTAAEMVLHNRAYNRQSAARRK